MNCPYTNRYLKINYNHKNEKVRRANMQNVLVTGGAGFIGSNTANNLFQSGDSVVIVDNLSRAGSEKNLAVNEHEYRADS